MIDEKMNQLTMILDGGDYRLWRTRENEIIYDSGNEPPVYINLPPDMDLEDLKIVVEYARTLSRKLFEFTLRNQSTIRLAWKIFGLTQSKASLRNNIYAVYYFCERLKLSPDQLIADCLDEDDKIREEKIKHITGRIVKIVERDRARGLAVSSSKVMLSYLESFFRYNGLDVKFKNWVNFPRIRRWYASESPRKEDVVKMIDLAPTLRDKAIIAMLATSGLRIGTLLRLKYKHVMEDFEANRIPCMIRVDVDITKGKYAPYITFMNEEAVYYLKLYLEQRRRGTDKILPENINSESWLFVTYENPPKPLSYSSFAAIFAKICRLMNVDKRGVRYKYSVHSLRKFFKTQLISKGVEEAFVEYWMGHVRDTYTQIRTLDIDFLRNKYLSANLRIRESKSDEKQLKEMLKNIVRQYGYDPEKFIVPGATIITEDVIAKALAKFIYEDTEKPDNILSRVDFSNIISVIRADMK